MNCLMGIIESIFNSHVQALFHDSPKCDQSTQYNQNNRHKPRADNGNGQQNQHAATKHPATALLHLHL